jgi:taurine dioxygenase
MHLRSIRVPFGIIAEGVDLSAPISITLRKQIKNLLNLHQIIIFKNQYLTEKRLLTIGRIFGHLGTSITDYKHSFYPQLAIISNAREGRKNKGIVQQPYFWHSDGYFTKNPYHVVLLYCKTAPSKGGETLFADTRRAYATIPKKLQHFIAHKHVVYDSVLPNTSAVKHSLVKVNRVAHKKALYPVLEGALGIAEMDRKSGMQLLKKLNQHALQKKLQYEHKWQAGDLVIWDNLATLHAATPAPKTTRLLYRIQMHKGKRRSLY